jgi:hypothetical protein
MKTTLIHWKTSWRLVPSRFPPVGLFDRVADPKELDAVFAIESLTNQRLRDEVGNISIVPENERQFGPGTTPIMAAFTHLNPEGSRFSDGSYGVYYAANDIETALAETRYHRERFLQRTNEPPIEVDMRSYKSEIKATLHDIRGQQKQLPDVYSANDYGASQNLARELRSRGSNGIIYDSVRHAGGECVAIFRANIPQPTTQESHYCFRWNGQSIVDTYRKVAI